MSRRQTSYSYEDLLACTRGETFGADNAQLPAPPLLMVDRINKISEDGGTFGNGHIHASLDIKPDLWFFKCHFIGDPVMPGCLGLDAMWQLLGFYLGWLGHPGKGRALATDKVKFFGQVLQEVKLVEYHLDIKRIITGRLNMAIADGRVSADGKDIYTANHLRVGLIQRQK
ncbi:MAG: bifunctional 3-hydroxydecanoyl-ACP dehydratase/trans-2-decenoyl-ACP isomerase [Parvibaculales bacterium]